jgi:hypothetical protein
MCVPGGARRVSVLSAAMPLANANACVADSSCASCVSSTARVGLPLRE